MNEKLDNMTSLFDIWRLHLRKMQQVEKDLVFAIKEIRRSIEKHEINKKELTLDAFTEHQFNMMDKQEKS